MSDWDLMMPGMGLTAIGLTGVVIAYAGIAKTFIDGMHALTGLTMMFGLIFLACGILSGGVSTSNKAKATTLVIFGIASSFGAFAITLTSVTTMTTLVGVLLSVIVPTIVIAYAAMKIPQYAKPISVIFVLAAGVGLATFVTLGFVGPGAQFSLVPPVMEEEKVKPVEPAKPAAPAANVMAVEILAGASTQGNPDFNPDVVTASKGDVIEWTNNDNVVHTVTSSADFGGTFDSDLISAGAKWSLDTKNLAAGEYEYMCTVHPFMTSKLIVVGSEGSVVTKVSIQKGASTPTEGQLFFDPQEITISTGITVVWSNNDTSVHTVTSGNPSDGASGVFDSDMLSPGKTFEHKFDSIGTTEYYCSVHPWMTGKITVE